MDVLFLTNVPSPYRVDFFQELGTLCNLTVVYEMCAAKNRDKDWMQTIVQKSFKELYLNSVFYRNDQAFCPLITKVISAEKYDVIIVGTYSTPTGMWAVKYLKNKNIPYVINSDGGFPQKQNGLKFKIKKWMLEGAEAYLSTGKTCDEYLKCNGAIKGKIYHYPFTSLRQADLNKSVTTKIEKKAIKEELGVSEERIAIAVGRFIEGKGFDIYIRAIARVNEMIDTEKVGFYLVGGEPTDEYILLQDEYHITNLHYIPFKKKEKLKKYYQAADLFVLPTRSDVWGLVINEAMACGLPVITTDKCVAGIELIRNNGRIIPVDDIEQLAIAIKEILTNDVLRQQMAEKSIQIIENYTIENMAQRHIEIFKEVIKARK